MSLYSPLLCREVNSQPWNHSSSLGSVNCIFTKPNCINTLTLFYQSKMPFTDSFTICTTFISWVMSQSDWLWLHQMLNWNSLMMTEIQIVMACKICIVNNIIAVVLQTLFHRYCYQHPLWTELSDRWSLTVHNVYFGVHTWRHLQNNYIPSCPCWIMVHTFCNKVGIIRTQHFYSITSLLPPWFD